MNVIVYVGTRASREVSQVSLVQMFEVHVWIKFTTVKYFKFIAMWDCVLLEKYFLH